MGRSAEEFGKEAVVRQLASFCMATHSGQDEVTSQYIQCS